MNYIANLKKYWYVPLATVLVATVLSFVVSVLQAPKYASTMRLLVIQQQGNRLDAYSAARSAETIASVLSRMVYTSSFVDRVEGSKFAPENVSLPTLKEDRTKAWEEMVSIKTSSDGSLDVSVFHPDLDVAQGYAFAIADSMVRYGKEYHGGDTQIEIRLVDEPFTSSTPASPNIIQNTAFGFFAGLLLSVSFVLIMSFKNDSDSFIPKGYEQDVTSYKPVSSMENPYEEIEEEKQPSVLYDVQKKLDLEPVSAAPAAVGSYAGSVSQGDIPESNPSLLDYNAQGELSFSDANASGNEVDENLDSTDENDVLDTSTSMISDAVSEYNAQRDEEVENEAQEVDSQIFEEGEDDAVQQFDESVERKEDVVSDGEIPVPSLFTNSLSDDEPAEDPVEDNEDIDDAQKFEDAADVTQEPEVVADDVVEEYESEDATMEEVVAPVPMIFNTGDDQKKGPMPNDVKKNGSNTKEDPYNPKRVSSWMSSGKFGK